MTTAPLDAPLLERTDPSLARPLPAALTRARVDALAAASDLLTVTEAALAKPWSWIGGSEEEVRYGAYRTAEALEEAETEVRALLAADDSDETRAAKVIGHATAARWDLNGLLLSLTDDQLDADPGRGEWTIRLVMGHVISGQRAYGWGTSWWLTNPYRAGDPAMPAGIPDGMLTSLPDEATSEAEGTGFDLRARLDAILDLGAERLAGLPDDRLELGARWSGFPVTIGFRLGRWSSHIREHTIQIEKTLAMLDVVHDEPKRLARHVLAAYGRAEAAVFGRRSSPGAEAGAARIAQAAAEGRETLASATEAARLNS